MGVRPISVFSDVIASGAATSTGVNLGNEGWSTIAVSVSTMSTGAAIGVNNSLDSGTTWQPVFHKSIQSSTVATPQLFIASGVGTNGGVTQLPVVPYTRIQFVATAVVSGGVIFKVICAP